MFKLEEQPIFTDVLYVDFIKVYIKDKQIDLFCQKEQLFSEKTVPIDKGLNKYIQLKLDEAENVARV